MLNLLQEKHVHSTIHTSKRITKEYYAFRRIKSFQLASNAPEKHISSPHFYYNVDAQCSKAFLVCLFLQ